MIKVASYCRVSTDKTDQANSFETQQCYFREYIDRYPGWELYDIYADEGITGTSTKKRIQFNRMINDAYMGKFKMIITKEVSRFSRNILDTIAYTRELRAIGVGVIFANDRINTLEPEAEMMLSFLASLAQEESRKISSRVVWGQTRQMEKGVVFGRSLLGYDVKGGVLTINEQGAETVRLIFHKYAVEQMGTSEIARFLSNNGYLTYTGNDIWRSNTVLKILNNEKYVGDLVQRKTYTPDYLSHEKKTNRGEVPYVIIENHHEAIISRDLWELTQNRLQRNNKHSGPDHGHSNRYIFSGKIKCGECGSSFVGRCKYRKDGTKIRRWSCGTATNEGKASCDIGKLVRDDDAMQMLKTAIRNLPVDFTQIINDVTDIALDSVRAMKPCSDPCTEQDRVNQKKIAVMDAYFSGEISKEDMRSMNKRYDEQLEKLRLRKAALAYCRYDSMNAESLRASIISDLTGILNGEIESDAFYKSILESLTVFKDRHIELRLRFLPQVFRFVD